MFVSLTKTKRLDSSTQMSVGAFSCMSCVCDICVISCPRSFVFLVAFYDNTYHIMGRTSTDIIKSGGYKTRQFIHKYIPPSFMLVSALILVL